MTNQRSATAAWFLELRNRIRVEFENIETLYAKAHDLPQAKFECTTWDRPGGGGGEMSVMRGNVFEKVGVNISTVYGTLSKEFAAQIPGTDDNRDFFATGISLVAHMHSPLVPATHFNTRYIETSKSWFGGGGDLTPTYEDEHDTLKFHNAFKIICDKHNTEYYSRFKKECDDYFYLKHRKEPRGVGGIFYDYLNTGSFNDDFAFTQDVGIAFAKTYPEIVYNKMNLPWSKEQKDFQLIRRGRYVEFNLLYDRGTQFGLMTGGNTEAILMSMPPTARWP